MPSAISWLLVGPSDGRLGFFKVQPGGLLSPGRKGYPQSRHRGKKVTCSKFHGNHPPDGMPILGRPRTIPFIVFPSVPPLARSPLPRSWAKTAMTNRASVKCRMSVQLDVA